VIGCWRRKRHNNSRPEQLADWLAWFDGLEPVVLTPGEEVEWNAWRQQIKEYTIANMNKSIEGLFP